MSVTMGKPPETEIVCPWCNGERVVSQLIASRAAADIDREAQNRFIKPEVVHFRRERSCPRCGGRGKVPMDSKPPTAEDLKAWEEMKG